MLCIIIYVGVLCVLQYIEVCSEFLSQDEWEVYHQDANQPKYRKF